MAWRARSRRGRRTGPRHTRGPRELGRPAPFHRIFRLGNRNTNSPVPSVERPGRREQIRAQRWYREAKATKQSEREGRESERLVVPWRPGNHSEGPGGGKGAPCHETVGGKHGGCIETRGRVHETTADRTTRSAKPGDGVHVSGLLDRHRLADRSVPAYP